MYGHVWVCVCVCVCLCVCLCVFVCVCARVRVRVYMRARSYNWYIMHRFEEFHAHTQHLLINYESLIPLYLNIHKIYFLCSIFLVYLLLKTFR